MKSIQMKKMNQGFKLSILMLFFLTTFITNYAQTGLNFQGVARSNNNVIIASQPISLRLSILQGSATGNAEYIEIKTVTTNAQGLFTVVIGEAGATSTVGNFANINWKNTPLFLKIEMDPAAGNNFITMGTTQFQYVAYAQYANSVDAENISGIVPVARGGTGNNSLNSLKTTLAIDKINNTADADKPISTLTQNALVSKLNTVDTITLSNRIDLKANTNSVNTSLVLKEDLSNKSTDVNLGGSLASDTLYPTQKAVKAYVAASTVIADGAITTTQLADLAITNAKIATGISKSKVGLGNVENTALSAWPGSDSIKNVGTIISGEWKGDVISINKGGTGGTNSAEARRNLGVEIGVHVQAPLTPDYDYLTPTGSAIHLTNFPTLNQSTTGNAASATLAERANISTNIDAISNSTLTSLPTLAEVGIITTGTWSGSVIEIEKGGTGSTNASNARINLGLVIGTDVQAPLVAGIDYLAPTGSANGLTDFPILNQNTTGNAATANNVTGIVSIENGGTNSFAIPTAGGIGFGNGIAHAYTSAGINGQVLSSNGVGDPTWVTPNTISVPYTGATSAVDLGAFDLKVNNLTIGVGAGNRTSNTVLGAYALNSNTTGEQNVAVGNSALNANMSGYYNVAVGSSALFKNTNGNENVANGASALSNNEIGNSNTAIGTSALAYNVTGNENVANGFSSLQNNLSGSNNVAIGSNTLITNISGSRNTAIGRDADVLFDGITNSTAIGAGAIVNADNTIQLGNGSVTSVITNGTMSAANYTGIWRGDIIDIAHGGTGTSVGPFVDVSTDQTINGVKEFIKDLTINRLTIGMGIGSRPNNTVIGRNALSNSDHTGDFNTAIGSNVLSSNVAGNYNTSVGSNALILNTNGGYNTTVGESSLNSNTIGIMNTAIGYNALQTNEEGSSNTAIGSSANVNGTNLFNATAIGADALVLQSNTIQLGNPSVTNVVTSGLVNARGFVGSWNGDIIDIAHGGTGTSTANFVDLTSDQTILGTKYFLVDANINGLTVGKGAGGISSNTILGRNAFNSNISGFDNTAIGLLSLYSNIDGMANTALGRYSLYANTSGEYNTGIGTNALSSNVSGDYNSSLGALTLNANTSGKFNTATGALALYSNTTGENNTATGTYALNSNITGYDNTAIGYSSLASLTAGDDNTAIGSGADVLVGTLTNATAIGAGAIVNASNTIQLGNPSVTSVVTSGTISATGFVSATGYGTASGTSAQFLKADGSIDGITYVKKNTTTIAIGTDAGNTNQNEFAIAIGTDAGATSQGIASIGIGMHAGETGQRNNAIGIGTSAGFTDQGYQAIGIGENAAKTNQGTAAIGIGNNAGKTNQGIDAIAMGEASGNVYQSDYAIAIGTNAGSINQGTSSIVIGSYAGETNQGNNAIGIGENAGHSNQGLESIALGKLAGYSDQAANSIILNATGSILEASTTGFFVAPIRLATPTSPVYYDLATKEITYGTTIDAGTLTGTTAVVNGGTGLTASGTDGQVLTSTASGTLTWTTITSGTHSIGEAYGGGIVFYTYDGGRHGLIAATVDQNAGVKWSNDGTQINIGRDGITAGSFNTERIINKQGVGTYAAQVCANYNGGDYGDWYLPSIYELNLLYLQRGIVGNFASTSGSSYYWSSSESPDGIFSVSKYFYNGTVISLSTKSNTYFVRAIRAF